MKTSFMLLCSLFAMATFTLQAQNPDLVVQMGHTSSIFALDNADELLATGSQDQTIKLWNKDTGKLIRTLSGHQDWVMAVAFMFGSNSLISAGRDGALISWDVKTGKKESELFDHQAPVYCIAKSGDAKIVATGDAKGFIFIRNAMNFREISQKIDTKGAGIIQLKFSRDGKYIISAENWDFSQPATGARIKVWEVSTGKLVHELAKDLKTVFLIDISPDGKHFLGGAWSGEFFIWEIESGKMVKNWKGTGKNNVQSIAYFSDGKSIIVGNGIPRDSTQKSHIIEIWDTEAGKITQQWQAHEEIVKGVKQIFPTSQFLSIGGTSVKMWDIKTGGLVRTFEGFTTVVHSVSSSPDGQYLSSGSGDNTLRIWDLQKGNLKYAFRGHTQGVISTRFSPDFQYVASGSYDEQIKVWDLYEGKLARTLVGYDTTRFMITKLKNDIEWVNALAFTPNSKLIFSGSGGSVPSARDLKLWDIQSKKLMEQMSVSHPITALDFKNRFLILGDSEQGAFYSPEGKVYVQNLAQVNFGNKQDKSGTIQIFDFGKGGRLIQSISDSLGSSIKSLCFNSDGNMFAGGGINGKFNVWWLNPADFTFETQYASIQAHDAPIWSIGLSFGTVATGSADNTIRLFKALSASPAGILKGHFSDVLSVNFIKNKTLLASGSADSQIKIWDTQKQKELLSIVALKNSDDYVIYTPEGYYMATKKAGKAISFRIQNKVVGFEQLDLKYNRPDKVLKVLQNINQLLQTTDTLAYSEDAQKVYRLAYQKRVRKAGFDPEQLDKQTLMDAPTIRLIDVPSQYIQVKKQDFEFRMYAEDKTQKLSKLNVWVNGVPIYTTQGMDLKSKNITFINQEVILRLSKGKNLIETSVFNELGIESIRESFTVDYTSAQPSKPTLYLITINVGQFKDAQKNLSYAVKDGKDITDAFVSQKDKYQQIVVENLVNENAKLENILKLKDKLKKTKEDDVVMIFVSTHGLLNKNLDYYLATSDMDFKKPEKRGLKYEDLEKILDEVPARQKVLMLDACHSGEVDKEEYKQQPLTQNTQAGTVKGRAFEPEDLGDLEMDDSPNLGLPNAFELMNQIFTDLRRGTGATIISAAGSQEYALEGAEWKNGVFTYSLLSGLKEMKADLNKDGQIMLSEIQSYVQAKVPELTQGRQQPTSRIENLVNDFRVW
jgi:WD40 repeat protein/uncharacterized caspase-like protein